MRQQGVRVDLEAQTKDNQFSSWETIEIYEWLSVYEEFHPLRTLHNVKTYHEAIEEMSRRFPDNLGYFHRNYYFKHVNPQGDYNAFLEWYQRCDEMCNLMCDVVCD